MANLKSGSGRPLKNCEDRSISDYKDFALGLLFLKSMSDSFEARREELEEKTRDSESRYYTEDEQEALDAPAIDPVSPVEIGEFYVSAGKKGRERDVWSRSRPFETGTGELYRRQAAGVRPC